MILLITRKKKIQIFSHTVFTLFLEWNAYFEVSTRYTNVHRERGGGTQCISYFDWVYFWSLLILTCWERLWQPPYPPPPFFHCVTKNIMNDITPLINKCRNMYLVCLNSCNFVIISITMPNFFFWVIGYTGIDPDILLIEARGGVPH